MLKHAVEQAFRRAREKGWDKIYIAVDIHGVVLVPTYENDGKKEFYHHARYAMRYLTKRKDVVLMMYTCSHQEEIEDYIKFFEENEIHFDCINENTQVRNDQYGNYRYKPYMNILLDDKAGFHPTEWPLFLTYMEKNSTLS